MRHSSCHDSSRLRHMEVAWWDIGREYAEQLQEDFPGGPVVRNLPCNARDRGLIPGQGTKILHAEHSSASNNSKTVKIIKQGTSEMLLQPREA